MTQRAKVQRESAVSRTQPDCNVQGTDDRRQADRSTAFPVVRLKADGVVSAGWLWQRSLRRGCNDVVLIDRPDLHRGRGARWKHCAPAWFMGHHTQPSCDGGGNANTGRNLADHSRRSMRRRVGCYFGASRYTRCCLVTGGRSDSRCRAVAGKHTGWRSSCVPALLRRDGVPASQQAVTDSGGSRRGDRAGCLAGVDYAAQRATNRSPAAMIRKRSIPIIEFRSLVSCSGPAPGALP